MRPSSPMVADAKELNQRIAANFKTARQHDGLTQEELGRLAGFRRNEINAYENARRSITPNVLVRIAGALERDPSWFTTLHTTKDPA